MTSDEPHLYGWDDGGVFFGHVLGRENHEHRIGEHPDLEAALIAMCLAYFQNRFDDRPFGEGWDRPART